MLSRRSAGPSPLVFDLPEIVLSGQNIKMDENIAYFVDFVAIKTSKS